MTTKFLSSMIVNVAPIKDRGREELFEMINSFKILKGKEMTEEEMKYKHIKAGTFERLMGLLGKRK